MKYAKSSATKNCGNDWSAIRKGVQIVSTAPLRLQAAIIPRPVPIANASRKPTPTRKNDHGTVLRSTDVTGVLSANDCPRSPCARCTQYAGYAFQIGSFAEGYITRSVLMKSGFERIWSP